MLDYILTLCYTLTPWCLVVGAIAVIRYLNRHIFIGEPHEHKITLRKIDMDSLHSYYTKGEPKVRNVFIQEWSDGFNGFAHVVDYGVMKYTDESVKILQEQEYQHAKFRLAHLKYMKKDKEDRNLRWVWFWFLADALLLRVSRPLGISLTGYVEASSFTFVHYPLLARWLFPSFDNLLIYHGFEEIEHAQVTLQRLKLHQSLVWDIIAFPIACFFYFMWYFGAPIVCVVTKPWILFQARTYMNFIEYFPLMILLQIVACWDMAVFWLLNFPLDHEGFHQIPGKNGQESTYMFCKEMLQKRGVTWDIVRSETFTIFY